MDRPGLAPDPEVGADHPPVAHQQRHNPLGRVARNGKANALGHGDDGGVDADHLAPSVHQRPTGVSRVERCIRLDDVFDRPPGLRPHGAADGTNHTGGDRRLEPERMPDGDHQLADAELRGVAQGRVGETGPDRAQQRKVGVRVLPDQARLDAGPVAQGQLVVLDGARHVTVGQCIAIRGDDHPGTHLRDSNHGRPDRVDHADDSLRVGVQKLDVGKHCQARTQFKRG